MAARVPKQRCAYYCPATEQYMLLYPHEVPVGAYLLRYGFYVSSHDLFLLFSDEFLRRQGDRWHLIPMFAITENFINWAKELAIFREELKATSLLEAILLEPTPLFRAIQRVCARFVLQGFYRLYDSVFLPEKKLNLLEYFINFFSSHVSHGYPQVGLTWRYGSIQDGTPTIDYVVEFFAHDQNTWARRVLALHDYFPSLFSFLDLDHGYTFYFLNAQEQVPGKLFTAFPKLFFDAVFRYSPAKVKWLSQEIEG